MLQLFTFMKSKAKRGETVDSDIDNELDIISNIIIDSYLAMTPEQRKLFIKKSKENKLQK